MAKKFLGRRKQVHNRSDAGGLRDLLMRPFEYFLECMNYNRKTKLFFNLQKKYILCLFFVFIVIDKILKFVTLLIPTL